MFANWRKLAVFNFLLFNFNVGPIPFIMADNAKKEFRRFLDNDTDPLDVNNFHLILTNLSFL